MQMHIDNRELKPTIDAVEYAINIISTEVGNGQIHDGPIVNRTLEQLKMLRLALMLGAAKEQREGRASLSCTCCAGDESQWFTPGTCKAHPRDDTLSRALHTDGGARFCEGRHRQRPQNPRTLRFMSYLIRIVGPVLLGTATLVTLAMIAMHSAQDARHQELAREAPGASERAATTATMEKIAAETLDADQRKEASADATYEQTAQRQKLRALEAADRQWLATHPLSPPRQAPPPTKGKSRSASGTARMSVRYAHKNREVEICTGHNNYR